MLQQYMKLRVKLAVHFVCFSMHCFNITHGEYVVAVYVRTEFFKKKQTYRGVKVF